MREKIFHEAAHALDDFAVTRYDNFTMLETGMASNEFPSSFASNGTCPLNHKLFHAFVQSSKHHLDEIMADVIKFLIDPDGLNKARAFFEEHLDEENCSFVNKTQSRSVDEFVNRDPFIQSVKAFLDNYPNIPGVSLEEQYNTGFWSPIIRVRLW